MSSPSAHYDAVIIGAGPLSRFLAQVASGMDYRVIVCDPRDPSMKDHLNRRIKHREGFRPFAPSVLEERTGDWFEMAGASPFMLMIRRMLTMQSQSSSTPES